MTLTIARSENAVEFHPRGAVRELAWHTEPEVILAGPAGTGKTYGCLWWLHLAALKYPGMRGLMVRKVLEALVSSALVTYQSRILTSGNWGVRTFGGSKLKPAGFQYPNGSELLVGGLDKAEKVMSHEYDLIYVNEATEPTEEDWENLNTRARWGVMPYQQLLGDCNPQGPAHWLYKRVQVGKTTMLQSHHEDNPALHDGRDWTDAGRAYLDRLDALSGFRRDRLRFGLWTAAEGAVYPAFNRATHVTAVNCDGWATVLGLDVGTRNPTALLMLRHAGDRIHIERELYRRGMSSDDITDETEKEYRRSGASHVVVDPSAAALIASLTRRGVRCRKADNDILIGVSRVTSALEALTVDPSCENTIEEFETYRYPDGARSNTDVPLKVSDHAMDVVRYLCMDLRGRPQGKGGLI